MKKINFVLIILFALNSCGTLKEAGKVIRNEKIVTTDEFLVKKRNPLVLPPDYEEIPLPGSIRENKKKQEDRIKTILGASEIKNPGNKSSSIEEQILDKIRK